MRSGWLWLFIPGMFLLINQTAGALDLEKAIDSALANSFELKRLQEKTLASRYAIQEKQGFFNPSLEIGYDHSEAEAFSVSRTTTRTDDYSISLSQPLYKPSLWNDFQEAATTKRINEIRFLEAKDKLVLDTLVAVLNICRIRSRLAVTENSLKFVEQNLVFQKKRLKADYGSRFDLLETEAETFRYRKELQETRSRLKSEHIRFEQLTGQRWELEKFPTFSGLSDLEIDLPFSKKKEYWIDQAFQNNSQLKVLYLNQKIGRIQQSRSISTFKPELDLIITHNQTQTESGTTIREMDNTIKLSVSLGFSPVSAYFRLRRFDSELQVLVLEEEKIKKDLKNKIETLVNTLELRKKDLEVQRQWMAKQEEIGKMYEKGLAQRHFPISQVLEASRKRNESQLGSVGTVIEVWETRVNLLHISGQFNEGALKKLDQVF